MLRTGQESGRNIQGGIQMLGKLIKYEFKALYKKVLLCVAGGLLISILTLLMFQLTAASDGNNIMLQFF